MKDTLLRDGVVQISIVIPVWNEEKENIRELYLRLTKVLISLERTYEIIFVDDGSKDGTFEVLKSLHRGDKRVKLVRLKKNFGQLAAFLAGLDYAHGKIIVTMDADLQYAPEDIPKLIKKIDEGFDAVSGKRINKCSPLFTRRIPSYFINLFISKKVGLRLDYGCSFNAARREAIERLKGYDRRRFVKPLLAKLVNSFAELEVRHYPRKRGGSKYNFFRLVYLGLDTLMNLSLKPSRRDEPLFSIERIIE